MADGTPPAPEPESAVPSATAASSLPVLPQPAEAPISGLPVVLSISVAEVSNPDPPPRGPRPRNIDHLPLRLLGKILSLVPESQYADLKEVSPRWEAYIDQHLGVPINVGKYSDFQDASVIPFSPVTRLREIGISACYLSNIHHLRLPSFKYPNLVRRISFIDYISESCFLHILRPLTNLRTLILDLSSIHYLEFINLSLDFLNRLQCLQVSNGEYSSSWNDDVHPSRNEVKITLDNTNSLLSHVRFPSLRALRIGFPLCAPNMRNSDFVLAVFHCLLAHKDTIRTLEILFDGKLEALEEEEEGEEAQSLAAFEIQSLAGVKLSTFMINVQEEHQAGGLTAAWLAFLETQEQLERCNFLPRGTEDDTVVELPLPVPMIARNAATLQVFKWFLEEAYPNLRINCEVFQPCSSLLNIHIASVGSTPSRLEGVGSLPLSLHSLHVEGINVGQEDIETMVSGLPGLQSLQLGSIGQTEGMGMSMPTLQGIFDRKTLKRLMVSYGFNSESVKRTPSEPNSFSFILMLVKNKYSEEDEFFHMKLCENGEYAIIPPIT